jgi:molecular chaperone DnaJ
VNKKKNFYKVLNVGRDATPSEIKKAYRRAVKKYHPDLSAETESDEKFKQVQEAYETLSNPQKKTTYDKRVSSKDTPSLRNDPPFPAHDFSFSFFDPIDRFFSDADDFWSDFPPGPFIRVGKRPREQSVEILLTPEEAREGGEISLDVPLWTSCPRCRGVGRIYALICDRCRGKGQEQTEKKVIVTIPSGAEDGMKASIPINAVGMAGVNLTVILRIRHGNIKVRF